MAKALFISDKDVKVFTSLNGNVDPDKFIQYIDIAQDIHVLNYLGQDLYDKLQAGVIANTLTGNYETLLIDYVKPMLIHWAMTEYLPFAAYTIANKGVFKHGAEASTSVDKTEVDYLQGKELQVAQNYTKRMVNYILKNIANFPEYTTNELYDVQPSTNTDTINWYLD